MTESLKQLTDAYAQNYSTVRAQFFMDATAFPRLCAYLFTFRGVLAQGGMLRECKEYAEGMRRSFDGISEELTPFIATYLALNDDRDAAMSRVLAAYQALKEQHIPSPFLILTACVMASMCPNGEAYNDTAAAAAALYDQIQVHHPLVTTYDDLAVCALYVLSDKDEKAAVGEMECCAEILKNEYFFRNSIQSLSHVLAFYRHCDDAVARLTELVAALKKNRISLGTSWEVAALGALTATDEDATLVAARVSEVDRLLKKKNGFSPLVFPSKERHMMAVLLVALDALRAEDGIYPTHIMAHKTAVCSMISANITEDLRGLMNYRL